MEKQQLPKALPEQLRAIADKLGVSFTTVSKVYEAKTKNWRNCEVRGFRVRDALRNELTK
jgi:DNA-binding LacI/PurR family transcriptional regulator